MIDQIGRMRRLKERLEVLENIKLNEIHNPDGSVEFSSQQALHLSVENRTDDPDSPPNGEIWLRTDL